MVECEEFVEVLGEYIGEEYYRVFRMGKNDKEVTNKQFVEQIKKGIKNFEQLILFLDRNITVFAAENIETYRDIFCTCNNLGKRRNVSMWGQLHKTPPIFFIRGGGFKNILNKIYYI